MNEQTAFQRLRDRPVTVGNVLGLLLLLAVAQRAAHDFGLALDLLFGLDRDEEQS